MYHFRDTIETSEEYILPSEALKINGKYIENQIDGYRTLNVTGREALSPDVTSYTTGIRDGSRLKNKRYPERIITVRYQITARSDEEFRYAYNKLAGILNVEEAELIFNDEKDKFYIGTPCTIGSVTPGRNSVVGEFEILCADPFKYSVVEYEAEPDSSEPSVLLNYNGTHKAYPRLVASFHKENDTKGALTGNGDCGYIAFFTENEKIVQLGNPDETDSESVYEKSQTLVNSVFREADSWNSTAQSQWTMNNGTVSSDALKQVGTVKVAVASYAREQPSKAQGSISTTSKGNAATTLLTATSTAEAPNIKYTVTAKTSDRTENSVKVALSITAAMVSESNYWKNEGILVASVYIGGSWHNVTMKAAGDVWESNSGHSKSITVTVTGLTSTTNELTGIKFKATRNDSLGETGVLAETACSNLAISPYVSDEPETYYLTANNYGSGTDWHGPSITRKIPADASGEVGATNFTVNYMQKMSIGEGTDATNQLGAFQMLLVSGTGTSKKIVAGVNVYKGSSGNTAKLRFYVGSTMETMDVDLSYSNKYFNSSKATNIRKNGGTINFNVCGIMKTFTDSSVASDVVTEMTFTFSQFGTKPALAYNGLYYAKFTKDNCDTYADVPNKFTANDIVEADCRNGEIYLNGIPAPHLGALGNDWEDFVLTPGLNQIGYNYSDWVAAGYAPSVKIRYREVFI